METCEIVAATGSEAYLKLLGSIVMYGTQVKPRGIASWEIPNVTILIEDGKFAHALGTIRRPSLKIAATEAVHLIAGISSLEQLDKASGGRFSKFSDAGRLRGAYGPRTWHQFNRIVGLLEKDPDTRQAVITVWDGDELAAWHDVPCTTSMQVLIRDGRLNMRVTMRSNDAILGVPIDWMVFSMVQRTLAAVFKLDVGWYCHTVASMHLYDNDLSRAGQIMDAGMEPEHKIPMFGMPSLVTNETNASWHVASRLARDIATRKAPLHVSNVNDGGIGARVQWYEEHVPQLDEFSFCHTCRYVLAKRCEECL